MLKAKCLECSDKGIATFLFEGKHPKINEYYHLEEQTGKSLELNGLFHALIQEMYYFMFNRNQYQYIDGNVEYDFSCSDWYKLKDILKQKYGQGNVYKYVNDKYEMEESKDFYSIPEYVTEDYINGNKKRIMLQLKSWGKYTEKQASKLVDNIFKIIRWLNQLRKLNN